jgi:hypothetical protein
MTTDRPLANPSERELAHAVLWGMAAMAWWATGAAKGMVTMKPGTGSVYMWTCTAHLFQHSAQCLCDSQWYIN